MKCDSESMCGRATLANKPDYKSFKFSDNSEEIRGFKADKMANLKDKNIVICDSNIQDYEVDSDPFPDNTPNGDEVVRNVLEVNGLMAREKSINRRESTTEYTTPRSESEGSEERTYFYAEENVLDCESPELVTFFQESNYQVVKDIGIDRVVPSQEKCSIENCELDHNIISCFLNSDVDRTSELKKETLDTVPSISNGSKSSIELDCNKDEFKQCGSENLMKDREVDIDVRDEISIDGSTKKTVHKKLLLVREVDTNPYHTHLSNPNGHRGERKFDQVQCEEAVLANSMVFSSTEVNENKVDANTLEIEEGPQNASTLEIEDMPKLENDMSQSPTVSAVGHLSCPIASYSGRRSDSGSISLRSNSSTASTQSFAFPILPTEWNGSPVRMAKADRRHFWKHRRWRMCLFCCKF